MFLKNIAHDFGSKITTVLAYYQDQKSAPIYFDLGDGNNQVSFDLVTKLSNYAKNKNQGGSSFNDELAAAIYSGLSDQEKKLLKMFEADGKTGSFQVVIKVESAESTTFEFDKDYTQVYLNELKLMEDLDFKTRELKKFHRKMDKISGNLPFEEMLFDVSGTNTKPSNIHVTDIEKLDNDRIKSPVFV